MDDDFEVVNPTPALVLSPGNPTFAKPAARAPQQTVDEFLLAEIRKGTAISQAQAEKILKVVRASTSFEDLQGRLVQVFGDLGDGFLEVMHRALLAADMFGRFASQEEGR